MSREYQRGCIPRGEYWLNLDTYELELPDPLKPTEWPLNFHPDFLQGCRDASAETGMGVYCCGWEL